MARSVAASRWLKEPVAFPRRSAAGQEEPVARPAQLVFLHRPIPRHAGMHGKALLCAADGGLEQFVKALGPMGVEQQLPAGNSAWNRDTVRRDIVRRDGTQGRDRVERGSRTGPAGAVDGDDLAAASRRIEAEAIAAESRLTGARPPRAPRRRRRPRRRRCRRRARHRSRSARRSAWRSPPFRSRNRPGCVRFDGSPAMARPFGLSASQAESVPRTGLSRLGRHFAIRFAMAQFAWILR